MSTLILVACVIVSAQSDYTLEQVDMSPSNELQYYSTYVLDINNRGYFCGYYTNSLKENVGFIVTRKGVQFDFDVSTTGSTDNKVVSINDNDVALISSNTDGLTTLWKIHVGDEQKSDLVKVEGVRINTVTALKINNRNDISGWYQGQNSRWLFILHDSIVPPGQSAWQASRYMSGSTAYNTFGSGMDTNNVITGFYNDSPNFIPFLYNANTDTYRRLASATRVKLWDMNNSQIMVGEYQQANGVYMACIGEVQGASLKTTSLDFIFHSNTIQSVANGINDKGHVVGQFYDASTKTWKGFIYRPGKDRYGYEGYDANGYKKNLFSFENSESAQIGDIYSHWNKEFCDKYIDYDRSDTYLNDGSPLLDAEMKKSFAMETVPNRNHLDWKSFCSEVDNNTTLVGTALDKDYYRKIYKKQLFEAWLTWIDDPDDSTEFFTGDCFGFATLSLLNYVNPQVLNDWFNIPMNVDLHSFSNMDSLTKRAIVRSQFKQHNPVLSEKYFIEDIARTKQWYGLYRTKTYMMDTLQKVNIRPLGIGGTEDSADWRHAVFPHHIHTPKKLPFRNPSTLTLETDTIIIYDPNYADSPGRFVKLRSDLNTIDNAGLFSFDYDLNFILFDKPTYTELLNTPFTFNPYKTVKSGNNVILAAKKDNRFRFGFSRNSDYVIQSNSQFCSKRGRSYRNKISDLIDVKNYGVKSILPINFLADTSKSLSFNLSKYGNSQMHIAQTVDDISMTINRKSTLDETDNGSLSRRTICYGNPESKAKEISCTYTQRKGPENKAVSISATSIRMQAHDSLITRVPKDYSYEIVHPIDGTLSYDLSMYVLFPNELRHFARKNISLQSHSSHTITAYSSTSADGSATIQIDSNLDGVVDDSIAVVESPVEVEDNQPSNNWISVGPNPAKDFINVTVDEEHVGDYTLVLCDLDGRILSSTVATFQNSNTSVRIDLSSYYAGVYSLAAVDKSQRVVFVSRVVKE